MQAAEHIAFEIQHFRCYSVLKSNKDLSALRPAATQAVGYALLLHLRVLIEFFFCDPELDDCHVVHFHAIAGFTDAFPPAIDERTTHTVNKLLAHFSATRWEAHPPAWDYYDEYSPTIETLSARFELSLPGKFKSAYDKGYSKWIGHFPIVRGPRSNTGTLSQEKHLKDIPRLAIWTITPATSVSRQL